ncbi:MAG: hypothetical protein ACTHY8_01500 [Microbacterium gubbeenense]|uniref:hypothetical protein n=1 Tax=Microbacterium gubbeenense TaxID=159896 RepID=UPI003F970526
MRLTRRATTTASVLFAAGALLVACSGSPDADAQQPTASEEPSAPTCESILRPSFVDELSELGWSAQERPFQIGEHEVAGGVQCVWGDLSSGTDLAQMYGWAPIDADQAAELQNYLEENGWVREDGEHYVYLTEDPNLIGYLEEGEYGITYQFADGWVALADTKSGLDLVTWRG